MNDNFTGMNPSKVLKELEDFRSSMDLISNLFKKAGQNFFGSLRNNWFSPKAVEFSSTYSVPLFEGTVELVEKSTHDVTMDVIEAYNRIASVNRLNQIMGYDYYTNSMIHDFGALTESGANGLVGMRKNEVVNAVNTLVDELGKALGELGSLNPEISLFDKDNALKDAYANKIKNLSDTIIQEVNSMIQDLNTHFQNEIDIVDQAVNNSTDALNTN